MNQNRPDPVSTLWEFHAKIFALAPTFDVHVKQNGKPEYTVRGRVVVADCPESVFKSVLRLYNMVHRVGSPLTEAFIVVAKTMRAVEAWS